jgi:hypothetical protein
MRDMFATGLYLCISCEKLRDDMGTVASGIMWDSIRSPGYEGRLMGRRWAREFADRRGFPVRKESVLLFGW